MQVVRSVLEWIYPVTMFLLLLVVQGCAEVQLVFILFFRRLGKWVMRLEVVEFMCAAVEEASKRDSSSP